MLHPMRKRQQFERAGRLLRRSQKQPSEHRASGLPGQSSVISPWPCLPVPTGAFKTTKGRSKLLPHLKKPSNCETDHTDGTTKDGGGCTVSHERFNTYPSDFQSPEAPVGRYLFVIGSLGSLKLFIEPVGCGLPLRPFVKVNSSEMASHTPIPLMLLFLDCFPAIPPCNIGLRQWLPASRPVASLFSFSEPRKYSGERTFVADEAGARSLLASIGESSKHIFFSLDFCSFTFFWGGGGKVYESRISVVVLFFCLAL
jgi:hypothetical protein